MPQLEGSTDLGPWFAAAIDEDVLRYQFVKKKGYVRLHTNKGDLNLELHCDMVRVAVPTRVRTPAQLSVRSRTCIYLWENEHSICPLEGPVPALPSPEGTLGAAHGASWACVLAGACIPIPQKGSGSTRAHPPTPTLA